MMAEFGERDGYRCAKISRRINEEFERLPPIEVQEATLLAIDKVVGEDVEEAG
jgi:hypothetical protein